MVETVIQLRCLCNNYPWGKKGKESLAAQLCEKTPGTEFKIDESKDYAEMRAFCPSDLYKILTTVKVDGNVPGITIICARHGREFAGCYQQIPPRAFRKDRVAEIRPQRSAILTKDLIHCQSPTTSIASGAHSLALVPTVQVDNLV